VSLCDLFLIRGKTLMTPLWVISHFYLIPWIGWPTKTFLHFIDSSNRSNSEN
jgi:hypothetical protein